jgi:hypothetical protein
VRLIDFFLQAGKTTTKNRHTQETKGTNEHDKKEPKKRNSNLLEKQVLTPEDGQIGPKHVV